VLAGTLYNDIQCLRDAAFGVDVFHLASEVDQPRDSVTQERKEDLDVEVNGLRKLG
jgi:hypothetical protein